jgi:hypothetical protein
VASQDKEDTKRTEPLGRHKSEQVRSELDSFSKSVQDLKVYIKGEIFKVEVWQFVGSLQRG